MFVGGMAIDITELLETQESLRKTQEQFKLVTDTMAVGVTRCSRDLKCLWVNEQYARMLGRSAKEIIGRPIVEILGKNLFDELHPYFEQVLSGQKVSYEQDVQYPGAQRRWLLVNYSPTFHASGQPDGWVAVVADITDHKRAEQTLHEHEALKSAMLDASLDAIISIDAEGNILEWNPACWKGKWRR